MGLRLVHFYNWGNGSRLVSSVLQASSRVVVPPECGKKQLLGSFANAIGVKTSC